MRDMFDLIPLDIEIIETQAFFLSKQRLKKYQLFWWSNINFHATEDIAVNVKNEKIFHSSLFKTAWKYFATFS